MVVTLGIRIRENTLVSLTVGNRNPTYVCMAPVSNRIQFVSQYKFTNFHLM